MLPLHRKSTAIETKQNQVHRAENTLHEKPQGNVFAKQSP